MKILPALKTAYKLRLTHKNFNDKKYCIRHD